MANRLGGRFRAALGRLRQDTRGNVMLFMAAGVIPVTAAVGGGVDLTRAYMAQARLQQAVDAATLAGRKAMTDGQLATAAPEITKFLQNNYPANMADGTGLSVAEPIFQSESIDVDSEITEQGALCVTASTSVPTLVMGAFGKQSIGISADSCARRSGTNIDVVLVLDVTGSMAGSRLTALKTATTDFLETLDDTRTQLAVSGLRVRVGIVPYSQAVNIGRLLHEENSAYIATSGDYWTDIGTPYRPCTNDSDDDCNWRNRTSDDNARAVALDLSSFITNGGAAGTSFNNAYAWKGCVEMRPSIKTIGSSTSISSIPAGAWDIIDAAPGVVVNGGTAPAWKPYFSSPTKSENRFGTSPRTTQPTAAPWSAMKWEVDDRPTWRTTRASATTTGANPNASCPAEAKKLGEHSATSLASYVSGLVAEGGTLHDVGMYWGLAMISPQAPFVNETEYLAAGHTGSKRDVKKYIVFMTDGELAPPGTYSAWGKESWDKRIHSDSDSTTEHRKRFQMLCEAGKQQNVNISTIAFGDSMGSSDATALQNCATNTDQYYKAANSADLIAVFQVIANNIGYLRLSE
ncbi:pilus assembly protein TadG-related protein [Sphingoaurantiacus capsulatus]|uniref:Pilus assembly protein TadG-related protein n=1 Tax=Sphingoaurantiacus capsulatus TaxID=1771310 RepID=A0ABV7XFY3_9SPHN